MAVPVATNAPATAACVAVVVRNAVTDHFRRQHSQGRALKRFAAENEPGEAAIDRNSRRWCANV
jgi:hypothetical protein